MNEFDNIFGDLFSATYSADAWKKKLDEYWRRSMVREYYKALEDCKHADFRVIRNNDGIHKVEKR